MFFPSFFPLSFLLCGSTADSAVANILWREEGNTLQFSKCFCILVNKKIWQSALQGLQVDIYTFQDVCCNCPEESQSCFLSSTFLETFFLACPKCFIPLLPVCFLICFSDHLGRKHLHPSSNFKHFVNNTTGPVWWL